MSLPAISNSASHAPGPPHSHAVIVSIGDELLRGQILDTNAKWLSAQLLDLGIETIEHVTIPDSREINAKTFQRLALIAPLIIATGGLGPTDDDLTRDALVDVLGDELVIDASALTDLETKFKARGRSLTDMQRRQAQRPSKARCLDNPLGTAPGLHATISGSGLQADVFCLPGPPGELKPMFQAMVVPALRPVPGVTTRVRVLSMIGIGEGDAAKRMPGLMQRDRNPLVGITAAGAIVSWRLCARGPFSIEHASALLDADERAIKAQMGDYVFATGSGETTLAASVIERLAARSRSVGVVESCTGGMLGQMLTDVPGASAVFLGGLITYSNELKAQLADVDPATIRQWGSVSSQVALDLAHGGLRRLGVDHCLAITGVAGPAGGSAHKPSGTVYIAHAWRSDQPAREGVDRGSHGRSPIDTAAIASDAETRQFLIPGSRHDVRERASRLALGMLHMWLVAGKKFAAGQPSLLFQTTGTLP